MATRRILLLAMLVSGALALAGVGSAERAAGLATATGSSRSITVTGSGAVLAAPNRVAFTFGVTTQAPTAAAALAGNSADMRRVIAAVERAGVAARNVRTASVSLSPMYSESGEDVVGYTASNTVEATIARISRAGTVIDAAVAAGANQVYGPSFTRTDDASFYRRALKAAVANARAKAASLAAAAHVRLGPIRSVAEVSSSPVPFAEKAAAASPPIEPGLQSIQASVTVEFAVR
jgi:uncharacterized protein YggE